MVNIKLDKCGGLTEGLAMAHAARELGLDCMVGNMMGSSLAMAPAFLVGQLCKVVDLDGRSFRRRIVRSRFNIRTDASPVRRSYGGTLIEYAG
jgi:L-alanine-DL-glutamate epimerase-like enolase superfamily enzyme